MACKSAGEIFSTKSERETIPTRIPEMYPNPLDRSMSARSNCMTDSIWSKVEKDSRNLRRSVGPFMCNQSGPLFTRRSPDKVLRSPQSPLKLRNRLVDQNKKKENEKKKKKKSNNNSLISWKGLLYSLC